MNEVKRYDFDMLNCDEPSIGEFREHTEGDYTKFADFQSERAARIAAETKLAELEELEDAVKDFIGLMEKLSEVSAHENQYTLYVRNTLILLAKEKLKARSKS